MQSITGQSTFALKAHGWPFIVGKISFYGQCLVIPSRVLAPLKTYSPLGPMMGLPALGWADASIPPEPRRGAGGGSRGAALANVNGTPSKSGSSPQLSNSKTFLRQDKGDMEVMAERGGL